MTPPLLTSDHDRDVYAYAASSARWQIHGDIAATAGAVQAFLVLLARRFLDADANVDTISREAGITRNDLHPDFHRHIGTTPWRYIMDARCEVATVLLRDTDMPVWKVGALVGYPQPRTFARAFETVVGRSPSVERRRLRRLRSES